MHFFLDVSLMQSSCPHTFYLDIKQSMPVINYLLWTCSFYEMLYFPVFNVSLDRNVRSKNVEAHSYSLSTSSNLHFLCPPPSSLCLCRYIEIFSSNLEQIRAAMSGRGGMRSGGSDNDNGAPFIGPQGPGNFNGGGQTFNGGSGSMGGGLTCYS